MSNWHHNISTQLLIQAKILDNFCHGLLRDIVEHGNKSNAWKITTKHLKDQLDNLTIHIVKIPAFQVSAILSFLLTLNASSGISWQDPNHHHWSRDKSVILRSVTTHNQECRWSLQKKKKKNCTAKTTNKNKNNLKHNKYH